MVSVGDIVEAGSRSVRWSRLVRTRAEARFIENGQVPESWGAEYVKPLNGLAHYFDTCEEGALISRTIYSTNCERCLMERAGRLRGWRWLHKHNADEVAFLTAKLGDKVAGFHAQEDT